MNKFKLTGIITRKPYVSDRFAAFSMRPDQPQGAARAAPVLDVVVFDAGPIAVTSMVEDGARVTVTGHLGSKPLTDKAKNKAQIDGRDVWVMQLVADEIEACGTAPADDAADAF